MLVNRGGDDSFLEVGGHFGEEVGGDEFYFAFETAGAEGAADGEAVYGIDVETVEGGEAAEEFGRFLEAFVKTSELLRRFPALDGGVRTFFGSFRFRLRGLRRRKRKLPKN